MARILYSGIVSELKGSVKGTSFQRNAAGSIAKGKANSRFAPSTLQSAKRNFLARLAAHWMALDFGQKDAWNQYALDYPRVDFWGVTKQLSGIQWFMSINQALYIAYSIFLDDPPVDNAILPVPTCFLHATSSSLYLDFGSLLDISDRAIVVQATGPRRYTSSLSRQQRFFMAVFSSESIRYLDFMAAWEAFFGMDWATYYAMSGAGVMSYSYAVNASNGISSSLYTTDWYKP